MIIQDESLLKMWISQLVEDISDAEPAALALYIVALIKKPLKDADLEKLCSDKLSVFLQSHTGDFVSQLFATLKSGSYLTSSQHKVAKSEKPEPIEIKSEEIIVTEADELVLTDPESDHEPEPSPVQKEPPRKATPPKSKESSQHPKQSKEVKTMKTEANRPSKEDSRKLAPDSSSSRKTPSASPTQIAKPIRKRISPPRSNSAERRIPERRPSPIRRRVILGGGGGGIRVQSNRHYRDQRRARSKSRSRSPHIKKEKRPELDVRSLRRHRCRDFHEKGFCMRGDACPYDHGPDPVVVEDSALEKMVRTGTYDPSSSYGVNPPPPGLETTNGAGKSLSGATEGYNPEAPALTTPSVAGIDFSVPPPPIPQLPGQLIYPPGTAPPSNMLPPPYSTSSGIIQIRPAHLGHGAALGLPVQTTTIYGPGPTGQIGGPFGGGGNGMTMRGGRFKPYTLGQHKNPTKSLIVKKIPSDLNKIAMLDKHFSKFGPITNIQVQHEGRPDTALVTFKIPKSAMAAYRSTDPIFNNRFIKVFWQNDIQAQVGDSEETGPGEEGMAMFSESGPTIPLSSGPMLRAPKILPTYFAKTFAKPVESSSTSTDAKQSSKATEEEGKDEEKQPARAEVPAVTSKASVPTTTASPQRTPTHHYRPNYANRGGTTAIKRKTEKETLAMMMDVHKRKADLYSKLVDQQRTLLQKLQGTEGKVQKKKLVEMLKKIEGQAKKAKTELEEMGAKMREMQQRQVTKQKRRRTNLVLEQTIVPDRERKPSEQMTPKDLLASLDYDVDEEEEGERAKEGEESDGGAEEAEN